MHLVSWDVSMFIFAGTEPVDTETGLKEWKNEGNISGTVPECKF